MEYIRPTFNSRYPSFATKGGSFSTERGSHREPMEKGMFNHTLLPKAMVSGDGRDLRSGWEW